MHEVASRVVSHRAPGDYSPPPDSSPMQRNQRALAYPLAALAIVAVLIALRPKRVEAPDAPPALLPPSNTAVSDGAFQFVRVPHQQDLPEEALRGGVPEDRCERWFSRMAWGDNPLRDHTRPMLATLDAAEQRRFTQLAEERLERDPAAIAAMVTGIGQFQVEEARAFVLRCAEHPSNYLRAEAARALARIGGDDAALRAEQLLSDPYEGVRRAAVNSLIEMRAPAAVDVLRRYAEREPRDGLRAVLTHLGMNTKDPSVIPTLRAYTDRTDGLEMVALEALARFGDGNALDRLYALLDSPAPTARMAALRCLGNAPAESLEIEKLEHAMSQPSAVVRRLAAELVWHIAQGNEIDRRDVLLRVAEQVAKDPDPGVAGRAIGALYTLGRKDVSESYLRQVQIATGMDLSRALEFIARVFKDERAIPLIQQRLGSAPGPAEAAVLLAGLALFKDPATWPTFETYLRHAGPTEPRDVGGSPLSYHAALAASGLGVAIAPKLVAMLDDDLGEEAQLRVLDVLRGIPDSGCGAALARIASDPARPMSVRLAAIEGFAYHPGADDFATLTRALDTLKEPELAARAREILLEYL